MQRLGRSESVAHGPRWAAMCLLLVVVFGNLSPQGAEAAVLPRMAPLKVSSLQGSALDGPDPLPVVSTYTLYFGNNGATVSAPVVSMTAVPATTSTPTSAKSTAGTTKSTSKPAKSQCSKKHTTARVSGASAPAATGASESVGKKNSSSASSSTATSVSQQNTVFPTVAPASPTAASQRLLNNGSQVAPHNLITRVDNLVKTFHGITGRKARQVALILNNQTNVVANASRTETILSHLAEAYPNNSTALLNPTAPMQTVPVTDSNDAAVDGAQKTVHEFVMQAGRSNITLLSNVAGYGPAQVRHDLHVIRAWAGDLNQLNTPALLDETVAAIMSAAARYFPELSTQDAARVIMADIKAESDFDTNNVSGGRLDSGSSWGLMQVSPLGSGELKLFQQHATVTKNTYSWSQAYNVTTTPTTFGAGALLDWDMGKTLQVKTLTNEDLFRPWVNVHVATWIQSNLARTSSQDPYTWPQVYAASNAARGGSNDRKAWSAVDQVLVGSGLPRSFLTALGSWVAGPAVDGYGSYTQQGDDVSAPYFKNIAQGLSVLYGKTIAPSWLSSLTLHAGLVDFH